MRIGSVMQCVPRSAGTFERPACDRRIVVACPGGTPNSEREATIVASGMNRLKSTLRAARDWLRNGPDKGHAADPTTGCPSDVHQTSMDASGPEIWDHARDRAEEADRIRRNGYP
jgi:hypothetical protein